MIKNKRNNLVFFIAIFNAFFVIPFVMFTLYKGYQGIVLGKDYFTMYKLTETIIITFGLLIFIFSLFGYHGPIFL